MRYSNYEIKRFSAERLDIDFDILNDRFLQHIQEVGLGPGRAWINCSRQPLRIEDLRFCFLFQKINAIHDEISEAMKKTLLEFGIIKNEEEYYIGINGVGGSKMNALEAIGSHVMLTI